MRVEQLERLRRAYADRSITTFQIRERFSVCLKTLYRIIKTEGWEMRGQGRRV